MVKIVRSTIIDAPTDQVWEVLRDFNGHDSWHPAVAESAIERGNSSDKVGCVRRFTLQDGSELREQLPLEDVLNISSQIGHHDADMYGFTDGRNEAWAVIAIYLKPVNYRDSNTFEVVEQLRQWAARKAGIQMSSI